MAKVTYAPGVQHMHGHIGRMVYKERLGQDIVAEKPDQVHQPNSPAQLQQREKFREATVYAKGAMLNAQAHQAYSTAARALHSSPFAVAVKDYFTPPTVTAIDLSQYNKNVSDAIYVTALDDFEVAGVTVAIVDNTNAPVESGAAVFDTASGSWKYTATTDASAKPSVTVTATASDRPGHTGTLTASK